MCVIPEINMKKILLTQLFLISAFLNAQDINIKYVENYFDSLTTNNEFSGQVLIGKDNSISFLKSFGLANYKTQETFNDSTRYQIASLSKQFTASAILLLQQRGLINIDSTFAHYYPKFPYQDITLKQLLNHTSGLPEFFPTMTNDLDTSVVNGNDIMIEMLNSGKYDFEFKAGEKWQYCNISYCLLASLIEKTSGVSYSEFMKTNLFIPAEMNHTTAELTTDIRDIKGTNLAVGYVFDSLSNGFKRAETRSEFNYVYWLGGFYGDGSVVSSITDLFKWRNAILSNKILNKKSFKLLTEAQTLNDGSPDIGWGSTYTLGWYLVDNSKGLKGKVIEHPGGHPGFRSRMTIQLEGETTIIILSNLEIDKFWQKRILPTALK